MKPYSTLVELNLGVTKSIKVVKFISSFQIYYTTSHA